MPPTLKRALCIVGATVAIGAFSIREAHADATDLSIGQWQEMGAFFTGDVFNAIGIEKVESNGKTFIVAGASCTTPGPEYREDICMVAYDADTFELADFGDSGVVRDSPTDVADFRMAKTMAVDSANRLVVSVYCERHRGVVNYLYDVDDICLRRFLPDGSVDTTFGNTPDNVANAPMERYQNPTEIAFDESGDIIVSGYCSSSPCLVGFTQDGDLDLDFGDGDYEAGGSWIDRFYDGWFNALAIHGDHIYAAGTCSPDDYFERHACLSRWNLDGTPDLTFASDGITLTSADDRTSTAGTATDIVIIDSRVFVASICGGDFSNNIRATGCIIEYDTEGEVIEVRETVALNDVSQLRLIDGQLAAVGVMYGDDVEQFAIQLLDITRTDDARVNIVSSGAVGDYSSTFAVAHGDYIWASRKCYDNVSLCVDRVRYKDSTPPSTSSTTMTTMPEASTSTSAPAVEPAEDETAPAEEVTAATSADTTAATDTPVLATSNDGSSSTTVVVAIIAAVLVAASAAVVITKRRPTT